MIATRSIRIGRLAGVPIGIQPLWVLIVAAIAWLLGSSYYPEQVGGISPALAYGLGLASALLLFASILAHELGHAIVARRHGVEVEEIDLWLLGGVAKMSGSPERAGDELRYALAGPLVTAFIVVALGLVAVAIPASAPAALRSLIGYELFINAVILGFNLLPAFPLDGGRAARALIWRHDGDLERATALAARIGRGFGYAMIVLGLVGVAAGELTGLWLALIGLFVISAAGAEETEATVRGAFSGHEARELMSTPAVTLPARLSVADAVDAFFVGLGLSSFPVFDGERLLGLVDRAAIDRVPQGLWPRTTVGELASYDPSLVLDERQDVAELLQRPAFRRVGRAIVVQANGEVGIVSITDVERALRGRGRQSPPAAAPSVL